MRDRALWFLLFYEPLAEAIWASLRYLDNRRKGKPLSDPWQRIWMKVWYDSQYGCSTLEGDPSGDFTLTWSGPMPWDRERR